MNSLSADHWRTASASSAEGAALSGLGQYAEAEIRLLESFDTLKEDTGALPMVLTIATNRLVDLYTAWDKPAEANRYRAMLDDAGSR